MKMRPRIYYTETDKALMGYARPSVNDRLAHSHYQKGKRYRAASLEVALFVQSQLPWVVRLRPSVVKSNVMVANAVTGPARLIRPPGIGHIVPKSVNW
jgi:hypothetical protein